MLHKQKVTSPRWYKCDKQKTYTTRFSYSKYQIKNVALETAGTIDLDVEIKFQMGDEHYSIDVHRKTYRELKDLYKALLKIEEISYDNDITLQSCTP